MKNREEQIKTITQNNLNDIISICDPSDEYIKGYTHGFKEGAKWSDEHPCWISVKDKLPKGSHEDSHFSKDVLAVVSGIVYKGFYMPIRNRWILDDCRAFPKVTHWMPFLNLLKMKINMKKIILLLMVITSMISCNEYNPDGSYKTNILGGDYITVKVDSCEYISAHYRLAHKGNCKYCAERRKQELKELVEELKKK